MRALGTFATVAIGVCMSACGARTDLGSDLQDAQLNDSTPDIGNTDASNDVIEDDGSPRETIIATIFSGRRKPLLVLNRNGGIPQGINHYQFVGTTRRPRFCWGAQEKATVRESRAPVMTPRFLDSLRKGSRFS